MFDVLPLCHKFQERDTTWANVIPGTPIVPIVIELGRFAVVKDFALHGNTLAVNLNQKV